MQFYRSSLTGAILVKEEELNKALLLATNGTLVETYEVSGDDVSIHNSIDNGVLLPVTINDIGKKIYECAFKWALKGTLNIV